MVCEQSHIKVLQASLWAKRANLARGTLMWLCSQTMPKAWHKNLCLIRLALLRWYWDQDVFLSARKSMMLHVYMHSKLKRADTIALLDSGATENFMSLQYAKYLQLPIKVLIELWRLFNVDGTWNKAGDLKYYTDLHTKTGTTQRTLWYFLLDLGENRVILGYPWFTAMQPKINWAMDWISHNQLPIVLWSPDTAKAWFLPWQMRPMSHTIIGRVMDHTTIKILPKTFVPPQYWKHACVFDNQESKKFLPKRSWDHAIELKAGAPATLISRNIRLSQTELEELQKFIKEHIERGTIRPSKSPYTAAFFFIKKKNRKLHPV